MKAILVLVTFCCLTEAFAQETDLIFTADQNSNTVTIVDGRSAEVYGQLSFGKPNDDPTLFHPLYNGEINIHGIAYDPIYQRIAVTATVSNALLIIDASSFRILSRIATGRNPHEPRFSPDGKEVWTTIRGENYVSVFDANTFLETRRIVLDEGPGMVSFSNDGKTAYISSSFDSHFWIVDVRSGKIIRRLTVPSSFSPFVNTTPDGTEVWVTHKDSGMVTRISTRTNNIIESFVTGKVTNHLAFLNGLCFVSVGGENAVKVYATDGGAPATLMGTIATGTLPHGIWASATTERIFVVNELDNTLQIIDPHRFTVTETVAVGERPQALVPAALTIDRQQIKSALARPPRTLKGPKF